MKPVLSDVTATLFIKQFASFTCHHKSLCIFYLLQNGSSCSVFDTLSFLLSSVDKFLLDQCVRSDDDTILINKECCR